MFYLRILAIIIGFLFLSSKVLAETGDVSVIDISLLRDREEAIQDEFGLGGLRGIKEIKVDFEAGEVSSIRTTYDRGLGAEEIEKAIKSNYGGMITTERSEEAYTAWRLEKQEIAIILMESRNSHVQVIFSPFRSVPQ